MLFQLFQRIDDQRKRCFEVVGDVREEIDPGLGQFFHVLLLDPFQFEPLLEDLLVGEIAPDKAGDSQQEHRVNGIGPAGKKGRRAHLEAQGGNLVAPQSVVIGGLDLEDITPGRQVEELHRLLTPREQGPAFGKPQHPVGILIFPGVQVAVRRKADFEIRLPVRQFDGAAVVPVAGHRGYGPPQGRVFGTGPHGFAVDQQVGEKTFGFCSLCPIFPGLNRINPSVPPKSISPREVL